MLNVDRLMIFCSIKYELVSLIIYNVRINIVLSGRNRTIERLIIFSDPIFTVFIY